MLSRAGEMRGGTAALGLLALLTTPHLAAAVPDPASALASTDGNVPLKTTDDDDLPDQRERTVRVRPVDHQGVTTDGQRLRFLDDSLFANVSGGLELRVNKPAKLGVVLRPDNPWEAYRMYGMSVLKIAGEFRLYYQCWAHPTEIPKAPRDGPTPSGQPSLCVAVSQDGLRWTKPTVGLATYNKSKENNILWPRKDLSHCVGQACIGMGEPMLVWEDTNPAVPARERYKVTAGDLLLGSADGLDFKPMGGMGKRIKFAQYPKQAGEDHTDCKVHFFDAAINKYVAFCQMPCLKVLPNGTWIGLCEGHGPPTPPPGRQCTIGKWQLPNEPAVLRRVGRCEFSDLFDWRCDNNSTGLSLALSFDELDPPCVDLYTQDEMHLGGGDRLFFPSAFGHAVL
eukprot:SAG22_NODE_4512_length_1247_cov_1.487805_1_plen_395_part_01